MIMYKIVISESLRQFHFVGKTPFVLGPRSHGDQKKKKMPTVEMIAVRSQEPLVKGAERRCAFWACTKQTPLLGVLIRIQWDRRKVATAAQ